MPKKKKSITYLGKVGNFYLDILASWDVKVSTGVHFKQKFQQRLAVGPSSLARLGCGIECQCDHP